MSRLLFVPFLIYLAVINTQSSDNKDVEDLIKELFGESESDQTVQDNFKSVSAQDLCECVAQNACLNIRNDSEVFCSDGRAYCCPPFIRTPLARPYVSQGCGRSNAVATKSKVGYAKFGEFPWMAAVLTEETVGSLPYKLSVYACGGVLIHKQVVLTVAHCIEKIKLKTFKVRLGEWDTQTEDEPVPYQERMVQSFVIHPKYKPSILLNDLAVLFLEHPVNFDYNVDVICMPKQNFTLPYADCFASGWGKDIFGVEGRYEVIMKKIQLPLVARETCEKNLRHTRLGNRFRLDGSFICAGGEKNVDTCYGDGGSPLVCSVDSSASLTLLGLVSWGINCGLSNVQGVYVNVAMFREWIEREMAVKNYFL